MQQRPSVLTVRDPLDGYGKRRVCPNEEVQKFNAHLRMTYNREEIDLDFRGPFTFLRHVSTTSPYPTALYPVQP